MCMLHAWCLVSPFSNDSVANRCSQQRHEQEYQPRGSSVIVPTPHQWVKVQCTAVDQINARHVGNQLNCSVYRVAYLRINYVTAVQFGISKFAYLKAWWRKRVTLTHICSSELLFAASDLFHLHAYLPVFLVCVWTLF